MRLAASPAVSLPLVCLHPPRREVAVAAASAAAQENTRNAVRCGKCAGPQVEISWGQQEHVCHFTSVKLLSQVPGVKPKHMVGKNIKH